jgi:hypothetical protein
MGTRVNAGDIAGAQSHVSGAWGFKCASPSRDVSGAQKVVSWVRWYLVGTFRSVVVRIDVSTVVLGSGRSGLVGGSMLGATISFY